MWSAQTGLLRVCLLFCLIAISFSPVFATEELFSELVSSAKPRPDGTADKRNHLKPKLLQLLAQAQQSAPDQKKTKPGQPPSAFDEKKQKQKPGQPLNAKSGKGKKEKRQKDYSAVPKAPIFIINLEGSTQNVSIVAELFQKHYFQNLLLICVFVMPCRRGPSG